MGLVYWLSLFAAAHVAVTWIAAAARGLQAGARHRPTLPIQRDVWPFVSVIVPAWSEQGTLERCIASLRRVNYPAWEVIIVAGGPDGTYQAAVEQCKGVPHFRVIEQQPRGKNAALNDGSRVARGDVLVLLDADSTVSPRWLRALVAPMSESIQAITGNPVPLRRTQISRGEQMERIATLSIRNDVILQGSGSIAIHRAALERIGGFSDDVLAGVDWDLNARLAARGIGRAFSPKALVHTERPATLREYWHNELRWRRAHLASVFRLHTLFLRDVPSALRSLYLYALSWFGIVLTGTAATIILRGQLSVHGEAPALWALFTAWVMLRRMALSIEVAVYTREAGWLSLAWSQPLLLFVTFIASCVASVTIGRVTMHFKGPRTVERRR